MDFPGSDSPCLICTWIYYLLEEGNDNKLVHCSNSPGKLTWEHCCEVGSDQISRASQGECRLMYVHKGLPEKGFYLNSNLVIRDAMNG